MKAGVIVFPASNCDRDAKVALEKVGADVSMLWHGESKLPKDLDLIVCPGGFSYGDYLRCGAIAAHSPIMQSIKKFADDGGHVLGVCNGFQVLTESHLLPGTLMRNTGLSFVCKDVVLKVENDNTPFTGGYKKGEVKTIPIAHHDGNYVADEATIAALQKNNQIAFTYANDNPNGSVADIAGITNEQGNVLGMMPHPERVIDPLTGGTDGLTLFESLAKKLG